MAQSDHETHVRRIQRALRILSKNGIDILEVFEDGIFGDETSGAVSDYQRLKGFEPTGVVDKETWDNLMSDAAVFAEQNAPAVPIAPFTDNSKTACAGEECWTLYFAQSMLKFLSTIYSGFNGVEVNGVNDEATANNLRYLQCCADTDYEDGTLDKTTWNALANLFGVTFENK